MKTVRSLLPWALLWAYCGCAGGPLRTVEIDSLRNEVTFRYGFGDSLRFVVRSNTVEIAVLVPEASVGADGLLAGTTSRRDSGSTATAGERAGASSRASQSDMASGKHLSRAEALGSRARASARASQSGSSSADHVGGLALEDHRSDGSATAALSDRTASSHEAGVAGTAVATEATSSAAGSDRAAVLHGARVDRAFLGSGMGSSHDQSRRDAISARSSTDATLYGADLYASGRLPRVTKRSSSDRVIVGKSFDFVIDVFNDSGLVLRSMEIRDRLAPRIRVDTGRIRVSRGIEANAVCEYQELSVVLSGALKPGQSLSIRVPALVEER